MLPFLFPTKATQVGYPDVQLAAKRDSVIMINTLPEGEQTCIISGTVRSSEEPDIINRLLSRMEYSSKNIIVYGRNTCDATAQQKADQLIKLGFQKVHVYAGGLFEWLLLQDVFGEEWFSTTGQPVDILKCKPQSSL